MATLEKLIYDQLTLDVTLAGMLAAFGENPAVFEWMAPESNSSGWSGEQTPRLEYVISRQEDPERRVSGELTVTILDQSGSVDLSAQIDSRLMTLLDGAAFRPDEGTVSLRWQRSDLFDQDPDFRGIDVVFDLFAWPSGLTFAPDPVAALRDWTTGKWPTLQVDPETWTPSDATPAIYWRVASQQGVDMTSWGAWVDILAVGHVLAATPGKRLEWIRKITEGLALARIVSLSDGSHLLLQTLAADSEADPYRAGQIRVTARFGVLQPPSGDPTLDRAVIGGDVQGEVTG